MLLVFSKPSKEFVTPLTSPLYPVSAFRLTFINLVAVAEHSVHTSYQSAHVGLSYGVYSDYYLSMTCKNINTSRLFQELCYLDANRDNNFSDGNEWLDYLYDLVLRIDNCIEFTRDSNTYSSLFNNAGLKDLFKLGFKNSNLTFKGLTISLLQTFKTYQNLSI